MGATEKLMDTPEWDIALDPGTPNSVLDAIDLRTRLWATFVHTPVHWDLGDLSDANLLAQARFCGVYLEQPRDRLGLSGDGLAWWLGEDGDGGNLYSSTDATQTGFDLEDHLDARVFASANGLSKGSINANATTFAHKREGGDTRREMLDTIARMAPGGPYYWRINSSAFTIDVDLLATLWPTATTPTVLLSEEGGPAGQIVGLYASLDLDGLDGRNVRTNVQVDFADGVANGAATASLPATYGSLTGGSPVVRTLIDWNPKRPRPPTERWRKLAVWQINASARGDVMATAEINERSVVRPEITASIPNLADPHRYDITPGNTVYVDDLPRGLVNTANEVYYRGEACHPTTARVDEMSYPFPAEGGYYLRYWDGVSAFAWIDLTRYVVPEEGPVVLQMGTRARFPLGRTRSRPLTKRERRHLYAQAHHNAQLEKFVEAQR